MMQLVKQINKYHTSDNGAAFKTFQTQGGWVWTPVSCFLRENFRGPFATEAEAIAAGKKEWRG